MCECCGQPARNHGEHVHLPTISPEMFSQVNKPLRNLPGVTGVDYLAEQAEVKVSFDARIVNSNRVISLVNEVLGR